MEEWFLRFFQNLQLQLGLRDPKLTAPEKNLSGIFLETDTGENIDILLVGKDGRVEELRGPNASGGTCSVCFSGFCGIPCRDPAALDRTPFVLGTYGCSV